MIVKDSVAVDLNPTGLAATDELPLQNPPNEPLWAENYCYSAWDREQELGLWLHLGRMPYDRSIWRETVVVFLPDDRYFLSKAFARGGHERGPGSAGTTLTMVEPFRAFQLRFDGAGRHVHQDEVDGRALTDGPVLPFQLDLRFEAAAPLWDMGAQMKGQHWGSMHHEQTCTVSGEFRIGGTTLRLERAGGIRDHTRGPRDFSRLHSHVWQNAVFPSGRSFCLLANVERTTGKALSRAFLSDGRKLREVVVEPSFLTDPDRPRDIHNMVITDGGETIRIGVEIVRSFPMAIRQPNDLVLGNEPAGNGAGNRLYESRARYVWDGEVTYGLAERSCPLASTAAPS